MSIRRRSTVHDFASLRLHPDGSRVQAFTGASGSSKSQGSGSTNTKARTTRLARYTARDVRTNWVALDAGGTASIKQRRRARILTSEEPEGKGKGKAEELAGEEEDGIDALVSPSESSQQRRQLQSSSASGEDGSGSDSVDDVKDVRARKRRKFYHDFSFLDVLRTSSPGLLSSTRASSSGAVSSSQHVTESESPYFQSLLLVPSSDLLKCIHHFASEYYTARGCLFNAPQEARKVRKSRKLARLKRSVAKKNGQRVLGEEELELDSDGNGHWSDGSDKAVEYRQGRMEGHTDENNAEHRRTRSRMGKRRRPKEIPRRDMYKAFDGSALMAIGMLLQEHVMEMMSAEPPEDWLRQIESLEALRAHGVRGGKLSQRKREVDDGEAGGRAENEAQEQRDGSQSAEEVGEKDATNGNGKSTTDRSSSESSSVE